MSKQYMIVNGDQILIDMDLIFTAIRDANGDWEQVEEDMQGMLKNVQGMVQAAEHKE
jgi:hypothetical protein